MNCARQFTSRNEDRAMRRIWILSEFYFPDENATGYLVTNLARGLCETGQVGVICGMTRNKDAIDPRSIFSNGSPDVRRVWSTDFSKDNLALRMINVITMSISIFVRLLKVVRANDEIVAVTNPPTLPYLAVLAAVIRKGVSIVVVYDVFPEALVAAGLMGSQNPMIQIMRWTTGRLFRYADAIVVLGRDMKEFVAREYRGSLPKLKIIPNWADTDGIKPVDRSEESLLHDLGLEHKFVIGYVGNIGRSHDIEILASSALELSTRTDIHFLFIGNGAKKQWLDEYVLRRQLPNVTVVPFYGRERQSDVHNACDLAVISFVAGMAGLSVPSRMYNMMSAGKPIIAITEPWSELAKVIEEEEIGWVVPTHKSLDLVQCILVAMSEPERREEMGRRARAVAIRKYSFERILAQYQNLLKEVSRDVQ
jgi:glycosyltransferase involved in cell wall biosynthesis